MTLGAMARPIDQIGAAIPGRALGGFRLERLAVEEQELPAAERTADIERKRHVVGLRLRLYRRQRFQIGEQVAHVVELHALIGRVGQRRKQVLAVRRGALHHGGDEIRLAPLPDAVIRVGRDVRRVERAERRFQAEPAAEARLVVLVRRGMAGRAAAGKEHGLAVVEIGRVRRERARGHDGGHGHHPEDTDTEHRGDHDGNDELSQHRDLPRPILGHERNRRQRCFIPRPSQPVNYTLDCGFGQLRLVGVRSGDRAGWRTRSGPPRCARSSAHRARESTPPSA